MQQKLVLPSSSPLRMTWKSIGFYIILIIFSFSAVARASLNLNILAVNIYTVVVKNDVSERLIFVLIYPYTHKHTDLACHNNETKATFDQNPIADINYVLWKKMKENGRIATGKCEQRWRRRGRLSTTENRLYFRIVNEHIHRYFISHLDSWPRIWLVAQSYHPNPENISNHCNNKLMCFCHIGNIKQKKISYISERVTSVANIISSYAKDYVNVDVKVNDYEPRMLE